MNDAIPSPSSLSQSKNLFIFLLSELSMKSYEIKVDLSFYGAPYQKSQRYIKNKARCDAN